MNMHRKRHPGWMLLMGLVLGALLGACGAEQPTGETVNTVPGFVTAGTPTAGLALCMQCHPAVVADWYDSRHANVNSSPSITTNQACNGCHDRNGDAQQLTPNRNVVGCESCHGPGSLHVAGGGVGPILNAAFSAGVIGGPTSSLAVSGQFQTCHQCHQLLLAGDPASLTTPTSAQHSTTTGSVRVITDTHFATPGDFTSGSNSKDITGYAMDYASETVCTDCHNPHGKVNINQEWAQSAHADRNANADPLGYFSTAWAHYDWSMASRAACQRCHTTTGYAKYADALRSGNSALAKGISSGTIPALAFSATPSFKPEMLKCNGCHTNNRGALRNPGTITADYSYSTTTNGITYVVSEASHQYPDVKASNVCMACHTGRESGETLKNLSLTTAPTITSYANLSFINSHYLAAGGTVFTATGYEYDGFSYANISSYRHDQIGSSAAPSTGANNGPCVGCHMSRPGGNGDHLFMPVSRSTNTATSGHIDGVASEVCIYCHTVSGAGGLEDLLNERKEEYHEALLATMYVLDKRGFYFRGAHPYFYQARTASTTTVKATATNLSTTVTGTGTLWTGPSGTVIGGDYFKVNSDGTYYKIATVDSDILLTLETAYSGPTATETDFTIIRSGSAGGIKNWLTQSGTGITAASSTDTDTTGAMTGRNNLGAAFNLNLLEHDPGAYVHNRMYTKRLLYDTIDWADDNLMNNSVGTTLTTKLPEGAIYTTGAVKYLLPYGVLGIPAERP